jgi:hypothetical protein
MRPDCGNPTCIPCVGADSREDHELLLRKPDDEHRFPTVVLPEGSLDRTPDLLELRHR